MKDNEFTLMDVVSDRICDPNEGWRDRKPEEAIVLSENQKKVFCKIIGYRRRYYTKIALERYINNPRAYAYINKALGDISRRIVFKDNNLVEVYARQDYAYDLNFIVGTIAKFS